MGKISVSTPATTLGLEVLDTGAVALSRVGSNDLS